MRIVLQARVEPAQEGPSALPEVLPGVLAVEDDRHHRIAGVALARPGLADAADSLEEVAGGMLRIRARIAEADEITEGPVAEQHRDLAGGCAAYPGSIQQIDRVHRAPAVAMQGTLDAA